MVDKLIYIETEKEKYPMLFNLNVLEAIQEEYGSFTKWAELIENIEEPNFKALKFGLREAINEGIDIENDSLGVKRPLLTGKQVGRILTEVGFKNAAGAIRQAVVSGAAEENTEIKN